MARQLPIRCWLALVLVLALAAGAGAQIRTGAWVDEVIVVEEVSSAAAITRLEVGEFDIYAFTISDPALLQRTEASPFLTYSRSFGSYNELTFNPYGPEFNDGRLNPFSVPRIREAMNWLIDRDHIVNEIMGGMAVPKFFPITAAFPDYARYADTARALELKYAHDRDRARAVITEEMEQLGAQLVNGVWHYKGSPVEIIALIRIEDERRIIGDYVSNLLENLGFVVNRLYRTAAEATPLWMTADPAEGRMHFYTGGWVTTAVDRDQATNFDFFYTPRGLASPLWQAYQPAPELDEVSDRLGRNDFTSIEERGELFRRALELALEDSVRVWLVDRLSFTPRRSDVVVTADLAAGVAGAQLWAPTLRRVDQAGGTVRIGLPSVLTEPWNPLGGTNWVYDSMLYRGTAENGIAFDPYTGLTYPWRIERAEVYVKEGLPVSKTLDWVDLHFVPEIQVPADAWIDWDPVAQRFITVGEKYPEGLTANLKSVAYYPADLFDKVKWHDGSPISVGDLVISLILEFDRANPASPVYDESAVPAHQSFLQTYRGARIASTDPLVIEYYSDAFGLDAEWSVTTLYPYYDFGPGAWHNLAVGLLAEANQETAFTSAKASQLGVDYLNMIAGETVGVLAKYLQQASAANYIPYAPTLGQYISADDARERWSNLSRWYQEKGHFWLGTGVFYLERAYPVEKTVHLKRFELHPDPANRWDIFAEPMIAEADVEGPARVTSGSQARFDVWVTFNGDPYPGNLISEVKYLVIDSRGQVALVGTADFIADGLYEVNLTPEQTRLLAAGSNRLEVVVVPIPVSIPTFASATFVTTP
ncbi:MAG: ABC transporter substrate-binding protein [Bacillota bacterium]|nr:ABC transporter substrate-binding protein [Bacillota bacterium]REJ36090.1 MAG: ABC transporter substrate-binding protein [Bacillota bacterium]